jgi:hypothetical protein
MLDQLFFYNHSGLINLKINRMMLSKITKIIFKNIVLIYKDKNAYKNAPNEFLA